METCARCGTTFMPGVANCPGCGYPAGKAYTPPPVAVAVAEGEAGGDVFVFDDEGNPQFAPEPVVVTEVDAEPVRIAEPVAIAAPPVLEVAPGSQSPDVPEPWSRAGSPEQVPTRPGFSWGWAVLGFFLPLVGLIYGFAGRGRNPAAAHAALIGGIIGMFFYGFGGILNSCGNVWYF